MARYPLPVWGDRPITRITRRDCIELIDGVVDLGRLTMAHRLHGHLHRLFRWAVGRDILEVNPMTDLPRQGKLTQRDRKLDDAELAMVWRAASKMPWPFGPIYQLLILTGPRREEIGALRWNEVDGDIIRLPRERTKNDVPLDIPLSPQAAALIKELPHLPTTDLVFSTTGTTHVSNWSRAKASLDAAVTPPPMAASRSRIGTFTTCGGRWPPAWKDWASCARSSRPCSDTSANVLASLAFIRRTLTTRRSGRRLRPGRATWRLLFWKTPVP